MYGRGELRDASAAAIVNGMSRLDSKPQKPPAARAVRSGRNLVPLARMEETLKVSRSGRCYTTTRAGRRWATRQAAIATVAATVVALVAATVARADFYWYAGPKTWLPSYDAESVYDSAGARYFSNSMSDKSCFCAARVTFIDGNGTWHDSYTDTSTNTLTYSSDFDQYAQKGYCKNNSTSTYTAECMVAW